MLGRLSGISSIELEARLWDSIALGEKETEAAEEAHSDSDLSDSESEDDDEDEEDDDEEVSEGARRSPSPSNRSSRSDSQSKHSGSSSRNGSRNGSRGKGGRGGKPGTGMGAFLGWGRWGDGRKPRRNDSRRAASRSAAVPYCLPFSVMMDAMSAPLYAVGNILLTRDPLAVTAGRGGGGGGDGSHSSASGAPPASASPALVLVQAEHLSGQSAACVLVLQPAFFLANRTNATLLFGVRRQASTYRNSGASSGGEGIEDGTGDGGGSSGPTSAAAATSTGRLSLERASALLESEFPSAGQPHPTSAGSHGWGSSLFGSWAQSGGGGGWSQLPPGGRLALPLPLLMHPAGWSLEVSAVDTPSGRDPQQQPQPHGPHSTAGDAFASSPAAPPNKPEMKFILLPTVQLSAPPCPLLQPRRNNQVVGSRSG